MPKVPVTISQFWTFKPGAADTPSLPVVAFQVFAREACPQFIHLLNQACPNLIQNLQDEKGQGTANRDVERLVRGFRELFKKDPVVAQKILSAFAEGRQASSGHVHERILGSLINMYQGPNSRYLNYYGPPGTIRTVGYSQVLHDLEDSHVNPEPDGFRNKAVFIGFSDPTQQDQKDGFHTVFSQSTGVDLSGVEIAATAFANLVENLAVKPLQPRVLGATAYLWGFTLGVLSFLLSTWFAAVAVFTLSLLYGVFCLHQFSSFGIWFPLVVPVFFQAPLAFFGTALWKFFDTDRERQTIRKALGYFLPEQTVRELALHLPDIRTASQIVYATCLCTDVEKYTAIAERMEPKELRTLMNDYFGAVFAPVRYHGGIVSDVKGDSMLALWPTPFPDPAVRRKTCLAALDIAAAVHRFNRLLEARVHPQAGVPQFPTRIGLDAGRMSIGTIGAIDHYEYRAVGPAVNTVERIESLNKHLGTRILASEEVLSQLKGFLIRELGSFLLLGKTTPVAVHELMCPEEESSELQRRLCAGFTGALQAFRSRAWEEAIGEFTNCMEMQVQDGPSLFYIHLCESLRANPPGEDWDGVVRLDRK